MVGPVQPRLQLTVGSHGDQTQTRIRPARSQGRPRHVGVRADGRLRAGGHIPAGDPASNGWSFPPLAFNLPSSIVPGRASSVASQFKLPEGFGDQLRTQLEQAERDVVGPLWLHLARPYGYLGLLPWQRLLDPYIWMPVLRLPDFVVPPPKETPSTLDVILWVSMPVAKRSFDLINHLGMIARRVPQAIGPSRRVTFHVFTDSTFFGRLQERWKSDESLGKSAILHDPAEFAGPTSRPPGRSDPDPLGLLDEPWFVWMLKSLKGRSIDFVHFVGHGYFLRETPSLAVAESPVRNLDQEQSRLIGLAALNDFLNRAGAWGFACSSPEHNEAELGLRHLADMLAQLRPGAVLFHDLANDRDGIELSHAYRFLSLPPSMWLEPMPDVFLYCQPYQVGQAGTRSATQGWVPRRPPVIEPAAPAAGGLESLQTAEEIPGWLAATQRYVEQWNWRLQQIEARRPNIPATGRSGASRSKGCAGRSQIQELAAQVFREEKGGDS